MAKIKKIITVIIFVVFFAFVFLTIFQTTKKDELVDVLIPKGSSPATIAKILKDSEVISSENLFVALIKFYGYSTKLQAGLYSFNKREPLNTIIRRIKDGDSKNIKVTVPEGFNMKQIATVLAENKVCDREKFINLATEQNMEGFLFPNTYFLLPQMDEQEIIKVMNDEFNKFWTKEREERLRQINKPKRDIIILASIVEKEAVADNERPIIAGVFLNRLAKGMRLESCSTVLYAMGINKERLSLEDLKFDSPYNTYRYKGLPPGPICNPGAEAIDAVLYPEATDSLYFVSKGNGTHYFSSTFEQHVKNKIVSKKNRK